jgi:hypothetical protein
MSEKNEKEKNLGASARESTAGSSDGIEAHPTKSLCACVSEDAARCIALRYPEDVHDWDETDVERCCCSCHDFAGYDE